MKSEWFLDAAVHCSTGKVRLNNEDNFYFNGYHLKQNNAGLEKPIHKKIAAKHDSFFCVFDGMGGGDYGETASFAGARAMKQELSQIGTVLYPEQFLEELCQNLNLAVCMQQEVLGSDRVGSTMALLLFHDGGAYIANVGDSKIFLLRNGKLEQLSQDHDDFRYIQQMGISNRKPRLTQYLGMNPDKVRIEPYICSMEVLKKDRFLICSDGLTDMVDRENITQILSENKDAQQAVQKLLDAAMERGGVDNTTIMVCNVENNASAKKGHWLFPLRRNKNTRGGMSGGNK